MNYLSEVQAFQNWIEYNSKINKSDVCLWHTLMYIAYKFNWQEFTVPIAVLMQKSKLNKDSLYRARNKLSQMCLISFKEQSGNQDAIYKMNSVISMYGNGINF